MKSNPMSNMNDSHEGMPPLRIQLKVSPDEHPELYAELTKSSTRGFAAKRLKNLANLEVFASARRTGDALGNAPRRIVDIAASKTNKALTAPIAPITPVAAPISEIDC